MSNLLYTITAYSTDISGFSPSVEGVGCTTQYSIGPNQYQQSLAGTITTTSNPIGNASNNQNVSSGIFNRCNSGTGTIGIGEGYFGLVLVDLGFTDIANAESLIGSSEEFDWNGTPKDLTFHHPSMTADVYTVIVPSDQVVYQPGVSARVGNVLVWHVPVGELGLYGQNINLPFTTAPVIAADADDRAAEKMLNIGYGIILNGTSWYNQTW
ncbi:hypothetical protein OAC50_00895 [bacterium]|nr:hypothetical protein [bacterium]